MNTIYYEHADHHKDALIVYIINNANASNQKVINC